VQINFSYTFLGQAGRQHRDYVSFRLALLTLTEEHRKAVREFVEKDGED
jgi:hypothetical protein